MRLYSKQNKDLWYDSFSIHLVFPTISKVVDRNEWISNPLDPATGFDIKFNTQLIYRREHGYWYFESTLFGFGIRMVSQSDY